MWMAGLCGRKQHLRWWQSGACSFRPHNAAKNRLVCSPRSERPIRMETASVREASARVIAALSAAGRSRTTIKRHEAELNAFARFLQARGQDLPTEADCLDFVAGRSGCRLAGPREAARSPDAQLARPPPAMVVGCLDRGMPRVGQATAPPVDRCPPRFRPGRDEYL